MFFASLIAASVFAVNNPQAADSVARLLPTLSHSIAAIETLPVDKPEAPESAVAISVEETTPDTTTPKADDIVKAENVIELELDSPEFIVGLEHPAGVCEEFLEPLVLEVTQDHAEAPPESLPAAVDTLVAAEAEHVPNATKDADEGPATDAAIETATSIEPSTDAVPINDVSVETNSLSTSPLDSKEVAIKAAVPAELAESWPHLSDHTRATILMLIEADQMVKS
ncbi:hypothetical protein [Fuerstiella marisgermanici]|uniref:Uncharacterized protein n=1 Tax=Fuerstiella marisgermanici TaxID=1891926 RepID=A0A1P8WDH3_9PLAN|nr:hypothetical protein [Fuerstiella marisgermanici]APZ92125.1 hypothetical protein Fuma_01730 [Fuerstiella marisgermanici]